MSLEPLGSYFGSGQAKKSLQRSQQAFRLTSLMADQFGVPVNVIIRDRLVVFEVANASVATRLKLEREPIAGLCQTVLGQVVPIRFRVRKTGPA